MIDPVRLLDGGEELSADERRALEADLAQPSPLGAKRAVWGALGLKLTALSASAEAATASAGSAAASSPVTLALVKAAGIGIALGTAVSSVAFFAVPRDAVRPSPTVAVTVSAAPSASAPRAMSAPERVDVAAPSGVEPAPHPSAGSLPRAVNAVSGNERAAEAPPVLESESQRMARARALLRSGNAARALSELSALERDEPRGLLVQEREALLIEALSAVGQREVARERAAAFLKRYPSSPHARAVRRAAE
jgi:hypothetical protein